MVGWLKAEKPSTGRSMSSTERCMVDPDRGVSEAQEPTVEKRRVELCCSHLWFLQKECQRVRKGVAGARKMNGVECDPMPEAPVPEVYRLHEKGWRPGATPFVYIDNGHHVVWKELDMAEIDGG